MLIANLPEMVAARTAPTQAEAEANVWRLLVEWATQPVEVSVPPGEVEVVWDDSDDVPARSAPPDAEGWWFE
jgi:hypothetical protein